MAKLGLSIYPEHSELEKDLEYLSLAGKYGFQRVFTRLISMGDEKKEELIEAISLKEHERYERLKAPRSIKELNQFFLDVINQKNRRPYYFKHYVELSQICPTIYKMQLHVLMDLHEALRDAFDEFVEKQLLKKEFSLQYHGIISIIMTFMIHGLPDFYQTQEAEGETLSLYCFWSIILPCLSEKGREEYKTLNLPCPDFSLVKP